LLTIARPPAAPRPLLAARVTIPWPIVSTGVADEFPAASTSDPDPCLITEPFTFRTFVPTVATVPSDTVKPDATVTVATDVAADSTIDPAVAFVNVNVPPEPPKITLLTCGLNVTAFGTSNAVVAVIVPLVNEMVPAVPGIALLVPSVTEPFTVVVPT